MQEKKRFAGMEWLRFILGCYVMLFHTFPPGLFPPIEPLVQAGFFATSTFFALSGFILTHVYFNDRQMREPAASFLLRRFCNLYPIMLVALLLFFLVIVMEMAVGADAGSALRSVYITANIPDADKTIRVMGNGELGGNLLINLLLLQAWNPYYLSFNQPLWSVSTLFFFYLLFPLITPRLSQLRHTGFALLLTWLLYLFLPVVVVLWQLWGAPWSGLLQRMPPLRLPEFIGGILCYTLYRRRELHHAHPGKWRCLLLLLFSAASLAFAACCMALPFNQLQPLYPLLHNGLLLPGQLVLIYLCALLPDARSGRLHPVIARLGASSLCVFALHVPLNWLWGMVYPFVVDFRPDCLAQVSACLKQAAATPVSPLSYGLYVAFTLWFCVLFQQRFVVRVRKALLVRLLPLTVKTPPQR